MIRIGLAGWGDHPDVYGGAKERLRAYAGHFPFVEVDNSFYAIQPEKNYARWVEETPADFRFLVKAFQGMTGHQRGPQAYSDPEPTFKAFRESIRPVCEAGKLTAVLLQYPPWFDCTKANVDELRRAKERMDGVPAALEFRHQSWFTPEMRERTLRFMEAEGWMHSICDEPQAGPGSVPTVLRATHPDVTVVRFHGRNAEGWNSSGNANWREVRYLYRYNDEELAEWVEPLRELERASNEVCVVFNNNSGGDAADSAKRMAGLLGQPVVPPAPKQLELFD